MGQLVVTLKNSEIKQHIDKLYAKYDYVSVPSDIYHEEVVRILKKYNDSDGAFNENELFESLEKEVKKFFTGKIKEQFKEKDNSYKIIDLYINKYLSKPKDYNEALKQFSKLDKFLTRFEYVPTPNLCQKILSNNQIFSEIIKKLTVLYINLSKKDEIDTMFESLVTVNFFIDSYCKLNEISIKIDDINSSNMVMSEKGQKQEYLSVEETNDLILKWQKGKNEQARDTLIEKNKGLIKSIANRYVNKGLDFDDLYQEGVIGLMIAIERFDVSMGFKLTSYATYWIRQNIQRAVVDSGRTIRIPVHVQERLLECERIKTLLSDKLGREPTISEIACEIGMDKKKIEQLYNSTRNAVSVNKLIDDDDRHKTEVGDLLVDSKALFENEVLQNIFNEEIRKAIEEFGFKEQYVDVIKRRFGLGGRPIETLASIGDSYGVSRERIRQIEARVIARLRKSHVLKQYLEDGISVEEPSDTKQETLIKDIPVRIQLLSKKCDLNKYEADLVLRLIGFNERKPQSIEEIANIYNLSIEEAEQIKKMAFDKINSNEEANKFFNDMIQDNEKEKQKRQLLQIKKDNVESDENMARQKLTLVEYLNKGDKKYSDEDIANALLTLSDEEKELVALRYTDGVKLTSEETIYFYSNIIPKIKRRLQNPDGKRKPRKSKAVKINGSIEIEKEETITDTEGANVDKNISKEEYIKMLELLRTPTFTDMMQSLTPKEAIIVSLKLGYVDDKYFSTSSIANFFDMAEEEVRDTTKKALLMYQDSFAKLIDTAIDVVTDAPVKKIGSNTKVNK